MIDFLLHLEQLLPSLLDTYGLWIYAILFLIILGETGSVFLFFLPGDSLLIAIGALCSTTTLIHLHYMGVLLFIAAVLGYTINYHTGRILGLNFFRKYPRWFKPEYIDKTTLFFLKHGGKTILVARFVPFMRSIAPFAAGSGYMNYTSFMFYNVLGGWIWITLLLAMGYGMGNLVAALFQFL